MDRMTLLMLWSSSINTLFPFPFRMWRSTQIPPRPWPTPLTWPRWMASHTLIRYCASWLLAAWCRLSIFVLAWTAIFTTMASLHPFTHTSHHPLEGMKTYFSHQLFKQRKKHIPLLSNFLILSIFPFPRLPSPVQVCRYYRPPSVGSGNRSRYHLPRFDGQTQAVGSFKQSQLQT